MRVNPIINNILVQKVNNTKQQNTFKIRNTQTDSVSFSSKYKTQKLNVDWDVAKLVTMSLSTSTSGHRAKYNSEVFNEDVVKMLTLGVADYAKEEASKRYPQRPPMVLIGGDARIATKESLPIINDTLLKQGVEVIYIPEPISTPALSMCAKQYEADATILMTASHNPWEDGGYNLITNDGAIAPKEVTQKVASYALAYARVGHYKEYKKPFVHTSAASIQMYPYKAYKNLIDSHKIIDWENIKNSGLVIYYDGLKGAGCNLVPRLLKDKDIPFVNVVSNGQIGPNPTKENLEMLANSTKNSSSELKIGLSNDGDADRFGVIDENGNFISTNDVLLLATYHLVKNRGLDGTILRSHSTSSQIDEIAKEYQMPLTVTPVGFKYIGEEILNIRKSKNDILIAGEESGGFTIKSHVPEKDGILAILIIADLVAQERKPLGEILADIKSGLKKSYITKSINKRLENELQKKTTMAQARTIYNKALKGENDFGEFKIDIERTKEHQEAMENYKLGGDGVKLFFEEGSSVLIRSSGTEPLIRYYIEAIDENSALAQEKLEKIEKTMQEKFNF